ncbi:MAG TPA: DNA gyrase inhibitor YacG [Candidatus Binatia bacterium]|nr:DNA gyrase inhibitor YacG [Candidatus Binatia bacterium]
MVRTVKCPTCHTPVSWQGNPYRPFCSVRCRTLDLGSWADEAYRIPGEQTTQEETTEGTEPSETKT